MKITKILIITTLCVAMITATGISISASEPPPQNRPSSWAEEHILVELDRGYVPVTLQYDYTKPITRAEFCALAVNLYEAVMQSDIEGRKEFTDTDDVYVEKAAYIGLVKGVGDNKFDPESQLTREMAAVLLANLADAIGYPLPQHTTTFDDADTASDWAIDAIGSVQIAEIMHGTGDNMFSPKAPFTREQSIITVGRLINIVIEDIEFVPVYHYLDNAVVQYIRTQYTGFSEFPAVTVIKSLEELERYIEDSFSSGNIRDGVAYLPENDFFHAVAKYTNEFFVENYLVFIEITENSGSNRHEVESISIDGDIKIKCIVPEIGTADMAQWHIIIELDAGFTPDEFNVLLHTG